MTTLAERICMLIQHETGQHNGMNSLRAQIQLLIDANDDPANPDNLISGKCAGCGNKLVCLDCDHPRERLVSLDTIDLIGGYASRIADDATQARNAVNKLRKPTT